MTTPRTPYVEGEQDGISFDARYTLVGRPGVAWKLWGWAQEWAPDEVWDVGEDGEPYLVDYDGGEWVADRDRVLACMVGDDRYEVVDREDLVLIGADDYCSDCGSTGCSWGRYA